MACICIRSHHSHFHHIFLNYYPMECWLLRSISYSWIEKTGYATADGAQPVHVNGWMDLLFPGFVLLQLQFYEEGDKQSKADAEGNDNPKVNAVMRHNTE